MYRPSHSQSLFEHEIDFLLRNLLIASLLTLIVESAYLLEYHKQAHNQLGKLGW